MKPEGADRQQQHPTTACRSRRRGPRERLRTLDRVTLERRVGGPPPSSITSTRTSTLDAREPARARPASATSSGMPTNRDGEAGGKRQHGHGEREADDAQRQGPARGRGSPWRSVSRQGSARSACRRQRKSVIQRSLNSHEASSHVAIPPIPSCGLASAHPDHPTIWRHGPWPACSRHSSILFGALASAASGFHAAPECLMPELQRPPRDRAPAPALRASSASSAELAAGPGPRPPHRLRVRRRLPGRHLALPPRRRRDGGGRLRTARQRSGGSTTQRVTVHVTPRAQNTPPLCEPASAAMRTDGNEPATIETHLYCWDYENDTFVLNGGGPGQHLDAPFTVEGGNGGGTGVPLWHYRTVTHDGEEATTFWATDDVGARSADTALTVKVGPSVDRLPECVPNPTYFDATQSYFPIYARPGATAPLRADLQRRGPRRALRAARHAAGARSAQRSSSWARCSTGPGGSERWVDGVYVPGDATASPIRFTASRSWRPLVVGRTRRSWRSRTPTSPAGSTGWAADTPPGRRPASREWSG